MAEYREIQCGFEWGAAKIVRQCEDDQAGVVLTLETPKESLQIRVTPAGMVRIYDVKRKNMMKIEHEKNQR